jgi:TPR repeat protein
MKAAEYYELAAEQDNPDAQFALSLLYWSGLGVESDFAKGKEYLELAAERGHTIAKNTIENINSIERKEYLKTTTSNKKRKHTK